MTASLVQQVASVPETFKPDKSEHIAVYAKHGPLLREVRAAASLPGYRLQVECVVTSISENDARIAILARYRARRQRSAAQRTRRTFLRRPTNDAA